MKPLSANVSLSVVFTCFTRMLLLFVVSINAVAQNSEIVKVGGSSGTCIGETDIYYVDNASPDVNYTWFVSSPGNIITPLSNSEVQVQWLTVNPVTYIQAQQGTSPVLTYIEKVYASLNPFVTTDNHVGCQVFSIENNNSFGTILSEDCINVCESSTVTYNAQDVTPAYFGNVYRYEWTVNGGTFTSNGQTTLSNSTFNTNPLNVVTVHWGSTGSGSLTVTEYCLFGCMPAERTYCILKIESPDANFEIDGNPVQLNQVITICVNQTVNFQDVSTFSPDSPILFWGWDFGDNTTNSASENPSHTYTAAGTYTVILTVTNKCGCISTFNCDIEVLDLEAPVIQCPSVVCQNDVATYSTPSHCAQYDWFVLGGTQLPTSDPANFAVKWDNVAPEGFGYISLDGTYCPGHCPSLSTIKVPVILSEASITGEVTLCPNTRYRYRLPAWPATDFNWTLSFSGLPGGPEIKSFSENGNEIEINSGSFLVSFSIDCKYYNTITYCYGHATLNVVVHPKPIITAPATSCISSGITCSLNLSQPTSGIIWTISDPINNITSVTSGNSVNIPGNVFSMPGKYIITSGSSEFCDPEPVVVNVVDAPTTPTEVFGEDKVCPGYPYTYTVDPMDGTVVNWLITNGVISGTTSNTATGNTVVIIWSGNGSISVNRCWNDLPGCCSSGFSSPVSQITVTGYIDPQSQSNAPCEDGSDHYDLKLDNDVIAELYQWSFDPENVANITNGQGTASIDVVFNHTGLATSHLYCHVVKCGIATDFSYEINILPTTSLTSLTPATLTVCSGVEVTFSVSVDPSSLAADHFIWNFGDFNQLTTTSPQVQYTYSNVTNLNQIFTATVQAVSTCNNLLSNLLSSVITVEPQPIASLSPLGTIYEPTGTSFSILASVSTSGNCTVQWYFLEAGTPGNGAPITGATQTTFTITQAPPAVPVATDGYGSYWAIVENPLDCQTITNTLNVIETANPPGGTSGTGQLCYPVGPSGINSLQSSLSTCGEISASYSVQGFAGSGGNIVNGPYWELDPPNYTINTIASTDPMHYSPVYTVNMPGVYIINVLVDYQSQTSGFTYCTVTESDAVIVPLVADFRWGLECNSPDYVLKLKDYSLFFDNDPVTFWTWTITDGVTTIIVYQSSPNVQMTPFLGHTITVTLEVGNNSAYTCSKTTTIDIPVLPVASFTISTTNPVFPSSQSCEGREVIFHNNSQPINNIKTNFWNFGDFTTFFGFYGTGAARVYNVSGTTQSVINYVQLFVTDNYGCTSSIQHNLQVHNNLLGAELNQYSLTPAIPPAPCSTVPVSVQVNLALGSTTPSHYDWYKDMFPVALNSGISQLVTQAGAYWVKLWDGNYCYKDINPSPAIVSFVNNVPATISGPHDVCKNDDFTLEGPSGDQITYHWTRNPGNFNVGTGRVITDNLTAAGGYDYTLTLQQYGCTYSSPQFHIIVHDLPAPPGINYSVLDCDKYQIKLQAIPGSLSHYSWSNGMTGSSILTDRGGPYRVWYTDTYGCTSTSEVDVPLAPSAWFWRFPTGCYGFCRNDLPRWVNGPKYVRFPEWAWMISDNGQYIPVSPNNGQPGQGFYTTCSQFWLETSPNGSGYGEYAWWLYNDLCGQQSDILNMYEPVCCPVALTVIRFYCDVVNNVYVIEFNANVQTTCHPIFFNIYIINNQGIAGANLTILSPSTLVPGNNSIIATFPAQNINVVQGQNVNFKIEAFCDIYDKCYGEVGAIVPPCDGNKIGYNNPAEPAYSQTHTVAELKIVPDPANTYVNISYRFPDSEQPAIRTLNIFDAMGKFISRECVAGETGTITMNVQDYKQGLYFVELKEGSRHLLVKKLIINH